MRCLLGSSYRVPSTTLSPRLGAAEAEGVPAPPVQSRQPTPRRVRRCLPHWSEDACLHIRPEKDHLDEHILPLSGDTGR